MSNSISILGHPQSSEEKRKYKKKISRRKENIRVVGCNHSTQEHCISLSDSGIDSLVPPSYSSNGNTVTTGSTAPSTRQIHIHTSHCPQAGPSCESKRPATPPSLTSFLSSLVVTLSSYLAHVKRIVLRVSFWRALWTRIVMTADVTAINTPSGVAAHNPFSSMSTSNVVRHVKPLDEATMLRYADNTVTNSRYTAWNFVPMNFYEQFKKPLNFYFLFVAALQFISVIAPVNPLSTLLPLLFAFSLTAVKEGYDDWKRHAQDAQYNSKMYSVLDNATSSWVSKSSSSIRVGDVIRLRNEDEIPCDVICVAAPHHADGTVYIRTDNLDGENDLKPRDVAPLLRLMTGEGRTRAEEQSSPNGCFTISNEVDGGITHLIDMLQKVTFVCPPPSGALDAFDARVDTTASANGQKFSVSLNISHLLPQSCSIRHTSELYAVVVYTGNETRCGMNKHAAPAKWANIDRTVSKYSRIIFACQLLSAFIMGMIGYSMNQDTDAKGMWYLGTSSTFTGGTRFVIYQLRFFLLTTVMIPVSFKFVVDLSKHFMALVLEWDLAMYDVRTGEGMKVRNSSIVEDLGQIEFVLSDKTGTMTENRMVLRHISVGGVSVPVSGSAHTLPVPLQQPNPPQAHSRALEDFCIAALLCNSVEVDESASDPSASPTYHGASPDEEAICAGILSFDYALLHRDKSNVKIRCPSGVTVAYRVHRVFPFSSEKKCMAILVSQVVDGAPSERDVVQLIIKGADDRIFGFSTGTEARSGTSTDLLALRGHLCEYATHGLRTLVFAKRLMTNADYVNFETRYSQALNELHGRKEACDALESEVEQGVDIIGCSAIEDKLQQDVKETIEDLITANVRVWMLTGDKIETAVQIARSCGLLHRDDYLLSLVSDELDKKDWISTLMNTTVQMLQAKVADASTNSVRSAVMDETNAAVDFDSDSDTSNDALVAMRQESSNVGYGTTSSSVAVHPPHRRGYVILVQGGPVLDHILSSPELSGHFKSLAFQAKTLICARVTPSQKARIADLVRSGGFMTLAIGDGGNDVAMIQQAHVGVGICGKEGTQASRSADFSVSKFSHLRSLMLYHGHASYARTAYVVQYSFYKSMLISFIQLVFNMVGTHMSGASFWNSFSLTMWNGVYTLPQTLAYCLDRSAPRRTFERNPGLYRMSQRGSDFNRWTFFGFVLRGAIQATVLFWLVARIVGQVGYMTANSGSAASHDVTYTTAYSAIVIHQVATVLLESHTLTVANLIVVLGMPLFYYATIAAYSSIPSFAYYGVFQQTNNIVGALHAFAIAAALFLPHYLWQSLRAAFVPNPRYALRHKYVADKQVTVANSDANNCSKLLSTHWIAEDASLYTSCIEHRRS